MIEVTMKSKYCSAFCDLQIRKGSAAPTWKRSWVCHRAQTDVINVEKFRQLTEFHQQKNRGKDNFSRCGSVREGRWG